MTPTLRAVARVVCSVAALALLAGSGCNRGKKYPTINTRNPDGGGVSVKGTYNHCPQAYFSASPDHTRVGQTVALTVSASDEENDPLKYTWAVTAGAMIDNAMAATTTLRCIARGSVTITLTVSDASCDTTVSGAILCQSEDAGADEDGGVAGAGGSSGSGQAGASGQAGTTGQAGASGQAGATGHAGTTGAGGAVGSGGTTGSGGGGGTACVETNAPQAIAADCMACLVTNQNPTTDGCCGIATSDPTGYTLCQAASTCMRAGGPPVGACNVGGDTVNCFCGTNLATCENPRGANGPCVAQMTAAAARNVMTKTTDAPNAMQVQSRKGDPVYALGRAGNIHFVAGAFCPTECGIGQ